LRITLGFTAITKTRNQMSEYYPDKWVIVNIATPEYRIRKVLGSWCGGFYCGDSYRLSSGITETIDKGSYYEIHNESGSIYNCYKDNFGMSLFTSGVYDSMLRNIPDDVNMYVEVFPGT
jgi:hypothetical protein